MNPKMLGSRLQQLAAAGLLLSGIGAHAQLIINDTLTGASSSFDWQVKNGACLTAGDGTGSIPKCVGLPYYSGKTLVGGTSGRLPDAVGSGALRLSNGDTTTGSNGNNQTGAVVSNFTFPTTEGIQVTWTSVSYGGNNYNGTGADGIAFFLSDGAQSPTVGAFGGSLGYSCANGKDPSDGVVGGYIGIGIDEFGNFSNPGDNTDTGPGFHAGRISVRGAGSTAWSWLHASSLYSKYYTGSTPNATAVQKTCSTGYAWNYSGTNQTDSAGRSISNGSQTHDKLAYNYPILSYTDVPSGVSLANQQATNMPTRGAAVPIIFALKITSDGLLDFSYSVNGGATQTVLAGFNITASNGPLPGSFRFGFSSGTGGGSNVHEITCFKATPANVANSSAGSNVQQAGQIVLGGTQVFLAYYHPVNWWGSMTANSLFFDAANDRLLAQANANWDGSCVLTGGACQAMGSSATVTVQGPTARNILTWNNNGASGSGIPLQWPTSGAGLTSAEQTTLGSADRVNYLRGDRTKEISNTGGSFRNRTSVLGDIVDSSPTFVGAPVFDYKGPWADKLNTSATLAEGTTYTSFASTNSGRMNVVYVGSNDGLLHGFRAGNVSSDGTTIANNDGHELLAYMPGQVLNAIHPSSAALDYSNTAYLHNFYVDATPGYGDLYYSNAWHTWLVGGLGPGGHPGGAVNTNASVDSGGTQIIADPVGAIYAIDVTNPTNFSESNAASLVIGEWNSSTISCTGNATCGTNMGQISGTPLVRRLHDGSWGVIWGNGLNSKTSRAGIFIMHVDSSGGKTFQYIDAGPGPANGIVEVTAADLDGDHITDFVYAGDVLGNVWRFDLHSSTNTDWNTGVTKLFTTSSGQPITTAPIVAETPAVSASGKPKLMIAFGTGQKLPITATASEAYASGTQSIYGVWDSNLTTWNGTSTDEKYDTATVTLPLGPSNLTAQTVTNVTGTDGGTYRTISTNQICWQGANVCSSNNTSMGYKIDLPGANEQVIYNPALLDDSFVVNTLIPQSTQALTCGTTPAAGFTMAPDIINGSGDNSPYTDGTNYYGAFAQNGSGVVAQYNYNGKSYDGTETNTGGWTSKKHERRGGQVSRVTWTKVR